MATAKVTKSNVVVTLELSEDEAQYVHSALLMADPTRLDDDTVYQVIESALEEAGISPSYDAATTV